MEFPARKCGFQNKIAVCIYYKWYHVNVVMNWYQKHPLSFTFGMPDNINVLLVQNQLGDFLKGNPPFGLELGVFQFIPDNIHNANILHSAYNVNCSADSGYGA